MLVLKRHLGDGLTIYCPDGKRCRLIVTDIGRGFVRLGFEFPDEYKIQRDELGEWKDRDEYFRAPGEGKP